jgi:hypothetical protein
MEVDGVLHSLHLLYDWGSTVTLLRKESARRMGLRPLWAARGFEEIAIIKDSCYYLPLLDADGIYHVICTYGVEEIPTVARMRLPPWAREVFPAVRAYMPWMDRARRLDLWSYSLD